MEKETFENNPSELNGSMPLQMQQEILDDIRENFLSHEYAESPDSEEKKGYIDSVKKDLQKVDTSSIYKAKGLNPYRKLYLIDLKYGCDVIMASERKKAKFYYKGEAVLNLQAGSILRIEVLRIDGNDLRIEGMIGANATGMPYRLFAEDADGSRYDAVTGRYGKPALTGLDGAVLLEGESFAIDMQIHDGSRVRFILEIDNDEIELNPGFSRHVGIDKKEKSNYCVKNGYLVKLRGKELLFNRDTGFERLKSELRLRNNHRSDKNWRADRKNEQKLIKAVNDQQLADRIAFVSVRNDGEPKDNLGDAYAAVNKPKVSYCGRMINKEQPDTLKAAECIYSSKVVVTDDYMPLFRNYGKKKGQHFVQLWHAAGAFKKFGADGTTLSLCSDAQYHRDYDLVSVSSEYVRDIYAKAFAVDREKVRALGVPRCDRFYDKDYLESRKRLVYEKMPEAAGRKIILYAPSFRGKGKNRVYLPEIDYKELNDSLREDQIMILCPHPLTPEPAEIGAFDKVKLVRDITTNDVMIAADLLITDYSSVIFDYSLHE